MAGEQPNSAPAAFTLFGQTSTSKVNNEDAGTDQPPVRPKPLFEGITLNAPFGASAQASSSGSPFGSLGQTAEGNRTAGLTGGLATPSKSTAEGGANGTKTSSLFGAIPATATTPATSKPFSFPSMSTTPAGPPPANSSGSLFSLGKGNTNTSGIFAAPPASKAESAPANQVSFFNIPPKPPGPSLPSSPFGLPVSKPSSMLFGTNPVPQPSSSLFGKLPESNAKAGEPSTTVESPQDQAKPQPSSGLFGSALAGAPKAPFASGGAGSLTPNDKAVEQPTSQAPALPTSTTQLSGQQSIQPPEKSNFFAKPTPSAPTSNLFANLGQKKNEPASLSSKLDVQVTSSTSATNVNPPNTSSSLFPPLGQSRQSASTSQALNVGNSAATTPASTLATQPAPGLGVSGTGNVPASSTPSADLATSNTNAKLGISTTGPAPTVQSRLKNKSMDDIITRWASDLSKYQKEFQVQAEKVAAWDRMLVDNSGAIAKLYSKTFQAERDTAEVQKQLTSVESQQDELSQWLDKYEREVDEMMSRQVGQGDTLQGPDQDRERTYKSAERVSEQLNEMGKDLTSMIEEINNISAAISKSNKPDNPLSQIVRILNDHLSQLQMIDQGTSVLQAKVAAAQKERHRLGLRHEGLGNSASSVFVEPSY